MDETRNRRREKSPHDYLIRLKLAFLGGLGLRARQPLYDCIARYLSEPQEATALADESRDVAGPVGLVEALGIGSAGHDQG